MTAALAQATGTRQSLLVVLPVTCPNPASPPAGWQEGPLPLSVGDLTADARLRRTYFTPAVSRVLYGGSGPPCRWHRTENLRHGPYLLTGIELLRSTADHGLAIFHLTLTGPALLNSLRAVARRPGCGEAPLSGPLSPATLLDGLARLRTGDATPRPYTIAFLTPEAGTPPVLRNAEGCLPEEADDWLWQLASCSAPEDFPTSPEQRQAAGADAVRLSADWSALVLRHGAAFLGHRTDTGAGDFYDFAALYVRSVYLDALLLGILQRDHIDGLTEQLSAIYDGSRSARLVRPLTNVEHAIARFRSTYWRQHLTAHSTANDLLTAFQAQYRLPERFQEVLSEAADHSRLVQTHVNQQIGAALGVLTIVGLPLSTALGILQVLGDSSRLHLLLALITAAALTAFMFTTRYGRLVLSALRDNPEAH